MKLDSIDVYLNGSFFYGFSLDSDRIVSSEFKVAKDICARLKSKGPGWKYHKVEQTKWYSSKRLYPTLVPNFFVSRNLQDLIAELKWALGDQDPRVKVIDVVRFWIDYIDCGVGVASIQLGIKFVRNIDVIEIYDVVDPLVDLVEKFINSRLARECDMLRSGYLEGAEDYFLEVPWYQDYGYLSRSEPIPGQSKFRELLWLHRTYIVPEVHEHEISTAKFEVRKLFPSTHREVPYEHFIFMPGISTSVILPFPDDRAPTCIVDVPLILSTMNLNWAILAVFTEADRTLFRRLNSFADRATSYSPSVVEFESASVLTLYDQVRLFQALTKTTMIDLGPPLWPAWQGINSVQRFDAIFDALSGKIDALQQACQSQLAQISAERQRRLGVTLDLFAIFGVVGSVAGVAAFLYSTDIAGGTQWRVIICLIVLLGVVLTILAREAFSRRRRK